MQIDECVAHLARLTSLPGLALDAGKGCQIVFDGDTPVDLEFVPDEDRVYGSAVVLPASRAESAAVHARALLGNGFGLMTAGAAFALDPVTRDLLLTRAWPLAATAVEAFAQDLARLVEATQAWRKDLEANAGGDAPLPVRRPGGDMGMIRA